MSLVIAEPTELILLAHVSIINAGSAFRGRTGSIIAFPSETKSRMYCVMLDDPIGGNDAVHSYFRADELACVPKEGQNEDQELQA